MGEIAHYVYGPVPSRRLGQSLGVDPIPFKTCNYNCVYCQLGRTRPLVCERGDYLPADDVVSQVSARLARCAANEIDFVTLVGQGEPTLCASLGRIIRRITAMTETPIAVITNGALLHRPEVREELAAADVVMPSLDAANQQMFRRINRPCPRLRIADIIEGLALFRQGFAGQLWVEVMLLEGLNDDEASLRGLCEALRYIGPERVQINLPIRPPAEPWVTVPDDESVMRATALLGEVAEVVSPYEGSFDLDGYDNLVDALLAVLRRHPMRQVRLLETLAHYAPQDVQRTLAQLESSGQARRRIYDGQTFWESTQVHAGRSTFGSDRM